jgi:asparagine synthase (glutamine-hydrolysing)
MNGEIYNYVELRRELADYPFRSRTDTEVMLAAYLRWGDKCLHRFVGMFAFLIWDARTQSLFAGRDRFGVKPLYYHVDCQGTVRLASEIKALHGSGVAREPDQASWACYLAHGLYDHSDRTFWKDIKALPAGHTFTWCAGQTKLNRWYDPGAENGQELTGSARDAEQEYRTLLEDSVRLRFRSDVPVGVCLSGGLDSSTLLGLIHKAQGVDSTVTAYTFVTGDAAYDELPWVQQMLSGTKHALEVCRLDAQDVPALASEIQHQQDEPFGGVPTLAYATLFKRARAGGTIVLLDGQGMDEQWCGYDYYENTSSARAIVQGCKDSPVRPNCLRPEFRALTPEPVFERPFGDDLRNLQYRDIRHTKIPRALRFNDRVSMAASVELREPVLDHRLVEFALRQPAEYKITGGTRKWLLRRIARTLAPDGVTQQPKRAMQTPQREWLRGPLRPWAESMIATAMAHWGGCWFDVRRMWSEWDAFVGGSADNSFYVWQWISLGMISGDAS